MTGPEPTTDGLTLAQLRQELAHLVSLASTAERPKPTTINPPGHPMPGWEWEVSEQPRPHGRRTYTWWIRTVDESETNDMVYVSSPDSMYPGDDFTAMKPDDARALAMALIAAADRAEHRAAGVPRLEDHRSAS